MEYWQGAMDWPLDKDWKCETCGQRSLTWGLVNGECKCNYCETQYFMRDGTRILTIPLCMLKPEYKEPIKKIWQKYQTPIGKITDAQFDEFMQPISK